MTEEEKKAEELKARQKLADKQAKKLKKELKYMEDQLEDERLKQLTMQQKLDRKKREYAQQNGLIQHSIASVRQTEGGGEKPQDTVGAMVDSDDFDSNGSGGEQLASEGEEAVKTAGIMRNAAQYLEEERNKAFYEQLDERIDHIINGLVQPVVYDQENGTIFIVKY